MNAKNVGRPPTGQGAKLSLRLPRPLVEALERHAAQLGQTRSTVIRRCIELGLTADRLANRGRLDD